MKSVVIFPIPFTDASGAEITHFTFNVKHTQRENFSFCPTFFTRQETIFVLYSNGHTTAQRFGVDKIFLVMVVSRYIEVSTHLYSVCKPDTYPN